MEIQPQKELVKRMHALGKIDPQLTPLQIMMEAKVTYSNYHNWQKLEMKTLGRWYNLMLELGSNPLDALPGSSTYKTAKQALLTRDAVKQLFLKVGYSELISENWVKGDPRHIENFKKVNEVVTNYEKEFQAEVVI